MVAAVASTEGYVELVVARGKEALVRCVLKWSPGSLDLLPAADRGARDEDSGVTLTLTPEDAEAVASGALDATVAFMRGQMKMTGDCALLLSVLPLMRGAGFDAARRCLVGE